MSGERWICVCVGLQAETDNGGAKGKRLWTAHAPDLKLRAGYVTSSLLTPAVLALGWALHSAQSEATSSHSMEYVHIF